MVQSRSKLSAHPIAVSCSTLYRRCPIAFFRSLRSQGQKFPIQSAAAPQKICVEASGAAVCVVPEGPACPWGVWRRGPVWNENPQQDSSSHRRDGIMIMISIDRGHWVLSWKKSACPSVKGGWSYSRKHVLSLYCGPWGSQGKKFPIQYVTYVSKFLYGTQLRHDLCVPWGVCHSLRGLTSRFILKWKPPTGFLFTHKVYQHD